MSTAIVTKVKTAAEILGSFNAVVSPNAKPDAGKNQLKNQLQNDVLEILEREGFTPTK